MRKPDRFFFVRALPPDPDWERMPVHGVPDPADKPRPDDHHGSRRETPPDDSPVDEPPFYDNIVELRGYRKPPRRRPRGTDTGPEPSGSGDGADASPEGALRCENCGGENPAGRKACRRCRRPLAPPAQGGGTGR